MRTIKTDLRDALDQAIDALEEAKEALEQIDYERSKENYPYKEEIQRLMYILEDTARVRRNTVWKFKEFN